ncbi:SDR family oxidoreductase [Streptomyces gobiensis]|uniref:SDR family oxidoreductase n=1 Tax=Streptomyces gobiensis TaxID=2875706 RepID=UPI001E4A421E|nr:SDR family oxidoreductase [Streptomyces gobiensis]UGY94149.1 SDR family oxidoreductase [Streptomyces gobiensis]
MAYGSTAVLLGPRDTACEVLRETFDGAGVKIVDDTGAQDTVDPDICCALLTGTAVLGGAAPAPALDRPRIAELAQRMADRGSGRMILVIDGAGGVHTGTPDDEAASRAADLAWWRQLAARVSASGVIANQIRVGVAPFLGHRAGPEQTAAVLHHLPLRRATHPADLAAAVLYLASEDCAYTVGETVPVDGGMGLTLIPPLRTPRKPAVSRAPAEQSAGTGPGGAAGLFDLTGRHCLVVGASSGIGRETALELARRGADVTVMARRERKLHEVADQITALGRRAHVVQQDVSRLAELEPALERSWQTGGRIDAMVYATGLFAVEEPGPDQRAELRERSLDINYRGYATLTDALVRRWAADGLGGAVVGVCSVGSEVVPIPHMESYGASKAAMAQYTRCVAATAGRHGIRANCVAPGIVETPMAEWVSEDFRQAWLARIPAGRVGEPQDVAALAAYLVGDSAGYVTGALLHVDGGYALGGLPPLARGGAG